MGSSRPTGSASVSKQPRMRSGDVYVVRLIRYRRQNPRHVAFPRLSTRPISELYTEQKLGDGHGGHRHVVLVTHEIVEGRAVPLGVDQDRRVEDQSFQRRSSIWSAARTRLTSSTQAGSSGAARRTSFTAAPRPAPAGPIRATARPRRTITNVSPRDSTASRTSANFRAASVAVTLFTRSDYQILGLPRDAAARHGGAFI